MNFVLVCVWCSPAYSFLGSSLSGAHQYIHRLDIPKNSLSIFRAHLVFFAFSINILFPNGRILSSRCSCGWRGDYSFRWLTWEDEYILANATQQKFKYTFARKPLYALQPFTGLASSTTWCEVSEWLIMRIPLKRLLVIRKVTIQGYYFPTSYTFDMHLTFI